MPISSTERREIGTASLILSPHGDRWTHAAEMRRRGFPCLFADRRSITSQFDVA